jgi:type IV secretion system protein VirB9
VHRRAAGRRHIFVKPKSTAGAANNLAVVTDKRSHSFRLEVLADSDSRPPVYRLVGAGPRPAAAAARHLLRVQRPTMPETETADTAAPSPSELIAERLQAAPLR